MNAIIWKELRQHRAWVVVGWLVIGLCTYLAAPKNLHSFYSAAFHSQAVPMVGLAAAILAMVLGFVQSYWDYGDRQSDYLRHRAVSEQSIWIGKVLAAALLFAAAVALPLLALTVYLARVGPLTLPTRPIQVVPVIMIATLAFFFQPAMMQSIRRPAAWLGTRFFPLIPIAIICFVFAFLAGNTLTSVVAWLICITLLTIATSFHCVPRVLNGALILASITTVSLLGAGVVTWSDSAASPDRPLLYGVDETNRPWAVQFDYASSERTDNLGRHYRSAVMLQERSPRLPAAAPNDLAFNPAVWPTGVPTSDARDPGRVQYFTTVTVHTLYYDHSGYLIIYWRDLPQQFVGYIGRDGFYPQVPPAQARFPHQPNFLGIDARSGIAVLSDRDGIYQLNMSERIIRKLIDGPIEQVYALQFSNLQRHHYIIKQGARWVRYELDAENPELHSGEADGSRGLRQLQLSRNEDLAPLRITLTGDFPPPPLTPSESKSASMASTLDGQLTLFAMPSNGLRKLTTYNPSSGVWQTREVADAAAPAGQQTSNIWAGTMFPPVLCIGGASIVALHELHQHGQIQPFSPHARREFIAFAFGLLGGVLISCFTVVCLKARYQLTARQLMFWLLSTLLLGFAAPLSMIAIYSRPALEDCPLCRRRRRVELECCEHCGGLWPEPTAEGIELLETVQRRRPTSPPF